MYKTYNHDSTVYSFNKETIYWYLHQSVAQEKLYEHSKSRFLWHLKLKVYKRILVYLQH